MTMTKAKLKRMESLMPNSIPRKIRVYDNAGKTMDRYTVVFTGNYNNIGKKRGERHDNWHPVLGMSDNPRHPQGFCSNSVYPNIIDYPTYSHLGKKITFADLPKYCQEVVISDYKDIWQLNNKDKGIEE